MKFKRLGCKKSESRTVLSFELLKLVHDGTIKEDLRDCAEVLR